MDDSNFFVATFNTTSCLDEIRLMTHITTPDTTLFVRHHRHFQRIPCFSCNSPHHSSANCAARRAISYLNIIARSPVRTKYPQQSLPAASGGATRAAGPTTDEWFDPRTNMKKRDSRLNAASATPVAASSPTPLRRLPRGRLLQSSRTWSTQPKGPRTCLHRPSQQCLRKKDHPRPKLL